MPLHCWLECKLVPPLWKIMWQFLKDTEPEIPFDPAIPLLGTYPQNYKPFYYKDTVHNSRDLEPTQMPINDRLDKENMAHIHHEILYSHKKDEFTSFSGTWMKLETIILGKLTQEQKMKYHIFSLIGG